MKLNINENILSQLKLVGRDELQKIVTRCVSWKDLIDYLGFNYEEFQKRDYQPKLKRSLKSLNIKFDHLRQYNKKPLKDYSREELINIVKSSKTWTDIEKALNHRAVSIRRYFRKININYDNLPRVAKFKEKKYYEYSREELEKAVKASKGWTNLYAEFNVSSGKDFDGFQRLIRKLNISTSHFSKQRKDIAERALLGPVPKKEKTLSKYEVSNLKEIIKFSNSWVEVGKKLGYKGANSGLIRICILRNLDYYHLIRADKSSLERIPEEKLIKAIKDNDNWSRICEDLNLRISDVDKLRCYIIHLGIPINHINEDLKNISENDLRNLAKNSKNITEVYSKVLSAGYRIPLKSIKSEIKLLGIDLEFNHKKKFPEIKINEDDLKAAVKSSTSWLEVNEKLGFPQGVWVQRTRAAADKLGLDYSHFKYLNNGKIKLSKEELDDLVKENKSFIDVARKLGEETSAFATHLKEKTVEYGIDFSHFKRSLDISEVYNLGTSELQDLVNKHDSWSSLCKSLGLRGSSSTLKSLFLEKGVDISKYKTVDKLNDDLINHRLDEIYGKGQIGLAEENQSHKKSMLFRCKDHGLFKRTLGNILNSKNGCPHCRGTRSIGEQAVKNYLDKIGFVAEIDYEEQKRFRDCRYKSSLSFDFYLPKLNICIEFQGSQHYRPVKYKKNWKIEDAEKQFEYQKTRDKVKKEYCIKNNIKLIEIRNVLEIESKLSFLNINQQYK